MKTAEEQLEIYSRNLQDTVIVPGKVYDELVKENEELKQLERQYARTLGRLSQLCDVVCPWVAEDSGFGPCPEKVLLSAQEIMEYVNSVRP